MRKLSKTLAMMGLLTPVGANALGVGEIKLHSALNQSLKADIPLITSASDSVSEVRVNLASPSAFAKAGLERPFYLSGLKFKTVNKGGHVYVRVTSRDVIREPFLNFLVDVSWPQGRMLREFTVLLDPPVTVNKKSVSAHSAPIVKSTTVTQPLYKVDDASNYGFTARRATNPRPAIKSNYKSGDFVKVERNDTLWGIAKRVNRSGSVSDEQMIVALYESNPQAFFKKNMNALKAGARLKIPQQEVLASSTKRQAIGEIKAQYDAWTGQVADQSQTDSDNPAAASSADPTKQPRSQLKLVAPSEKSDAAGKSVGSAPGVKSNKADVAIEMAETVSQENEELRSRLQQVEEQLAMMQRLIALKDKQLHTLQSKSGGIVADDQLDASEEVMDVVADDKSSESPSASTSADQAPISTVENQVSKTDNVTDQTAEQGTVAATTDSEKVVEDPVVPVDRQIFENKAAPVAKPVVQRPEPEPVVQEDDLLSQIFSEPMYLALGGGGIVLLGIFAWMLSRRKISTDQLESESLLHESVDDDETEAVSVTPEAEKSGSVAEISTVAESSFLSEFTPSDFDALETEHDEVDPVSEADVYLAYGRYQQAEDLIRSAIENYPDRDECKLKLFEIHYATEDKAAFEAYAEELSSMKNENPDFWSKVVEMGRELCPQNPVFGGTGSNVLDQSDNDVSIDAIEPEDPATLAKSIETPLEGLDSQDEFATDQTDEIDLGIDMELGSSAIDDDGMDFGLDKASDSDDTIRMDDAEDDADNTDVSLEFDASVSSAEDVFAETADESASADGSTIDGQAESNDLEFGGGLDLPVDEEAPVHSMENDDNSLDFDLDFASSSMEEGVDGDPGSVSDFADSDEIETKLDLAKAYVEMDDQDSARDILTEILAEGNDEQKTEAQALVDVIENKA